jgi:signal transduction histidine kinase
MGEGVLVLDASLRPTLLNASVRAMLGIEGAESIDRLPSQEVLEVARAALDRGAQVERVINQWFPSKARLQVTASPLDPGVLVLLQDVTQELLAQEIRKEFVAHASHELKSPVASIQTLSEALLQALEDDPEAAARFAQRLTSESARLGRLIGDLLDLSRLEDIGVAREDLTDLSEIVSREIETIRPFAEAKSMSVNQELQEAWVMGDEQQLGLMVGNLLQNAVRYTPEEGSITVRLLRHEDELELRVEDTGIGIPRDAQARIFERFYRVDKARSRSRGGTGLGLAIVKHVAELHRGVVRVESELGRGSVFTIELPATPNEADAATRSAAN